MAEFGPNENLLYTIGYEFLRDDLAADLEPDQEPTRVFDLKEGASTPLLIIPQKGCMLKMNATKAII